MTTHFNYSTNLLSSDLADETIKLHLSTIRGVSTASEPQDNTLLFVNNLTSNVIERIKSIRDCVIILNNNCLDLNLEENTLIYTDNPRKCYAILLHKILAREKKTPTWNLINGSYISDDAQIGENTIIEPFVTIGTNVQIGRNCLIKSGSRILNNVIIGDYCIIKDNCVIGSDGFGVERDANIQTYKIPHLGGVIIRDHVEVGSSTVIAQGTIEPTFVDEYTKIDDMVFIAHNVKIGKNCFVIANSEISGSVVIKDNCWIAPNACIRDHVTIGANVTIGMGAVVLRNVEDNAVIIGNPGKPIIR